MLRALLLLGSIVTVIFSQPLDYPKAKKGDVVDDYAGTKVPDPYRWLENTTDKEVEDWFKAQAIVTDNLLAKIPARDALAREWMEFDKLRPATYSSIVFENGRVFYKKTLGGENVGKLYFREGWNGEEQLLFDPSTYKVGVATVIQDFLTSWDGEHVVLGFTASGAEWSELRILNVSRQTLLPDSIYPSRWTAFSWTPDSQSFLYDGGNVTDIKSLDIQLNRKTRLHKVGSLGQADIDILSNESHPELKIAPKEFPIAYLDESYPRYVFGAAAKAGAELRLFYAPISDLSGSSIKWQDLCRLSDNIVRGYAPYGDDLYAITHTDAPKYKVVRTKLNRPDWKNAELVVPEAKDSIIGLAKSKN